MVLLFSLDMFLCLTANKSACALKRKQSFTEQAVYTAKSEIYLAKCPQKLSRIYIMLTKIRNIDFVVTGLVGLEPSKYKFCWTNIFQCQNYIWNNNFYYRMLLLLTKLKCSSFFMKSTVYTFKDNVMVFFSPCKCHSGRVLEFILLLCAYNIQWLDSSLTSRFLATKRSAFSDDVGSGTSSSQKILFFREFSLARLGPAFSLTQPR